MDNDVILQKSASIERAVSRAREEYARAPATFVSDITRYDAAILNIQRGCETAIDLAQSVVRAQHLGVASSARDVFCLLQAASIIDEPLSLALQRMVGFRNIALHEYQRLDPRVVVAIIERELDQLLEFSRIVLKNAAGRSRP
jgi:uncharacterized protein YutE (UPF0331/DUF86 family)